MANNQTVDQNRLPRQLALPANAAITRIGNSLARQFDRTTSAADDLLRNQRSWALAATLLLAIQLGLVIKHEPWLDEYQALQIALESPNLAALLENLHYEGHPPLWYFLLQATAIAVPSYWVLATLQAIIAISLQSLILFRSPFSRFDRLLIASSAFVLFEYGTLSRSLSLGVLLLTLFFVTRGRRWCWFPITLLPMADFLFGVLSIICIVVLAKEKRLWVPGILPWTISSLLAAWSVYPAPDMVPAIPLNNPLLDLSVYVSYLSVLLVPLYYGDGLQWNMPLPVEIAPSIGFYFIVFCLLQTKRIKFHLALISSFIIITAAFSTFIYQLQIRHLSLIAYLLILIKWIEYEQGIIPNRSFHVWLATTSAFGILIACINFLHPFDTSIEAAKYIKEKNLTEKHWISFPEYSTQGISAFLGLEFQGIERTCTQSFVRWNISKRVKYAKDFNENISNIIKDYGKVYLVTNFPIKRNRFDFSLNAIKEVKPGYNGQAFYIYTVGTNLPEAKYKPKRCFPENRSISFWSDPTRPYFKVKS